MIAGDAWVISSPGSDVVTLETLQTSGFPDELKRRGYPLIEIEPGSRILHTTFHQPMEISSPGTLIPATTGSTKPVSMIVHGTPLEIPLPVAGSFMADMKAYHAEDNPLKRDEIAARQIRALNEHRRSRDLKMRLVDVKNLFELVRGEG